VKAASDQDTKADVEVAADAAAAVFSAVEVAVGLSLFFSSAVAASAAAITVVADAAAVLWAADAAMAAEFSAADANASSSLSYFFAAVAEIHSVKIKLWRSILSGAIVISSGFFS
jgi:hypothetical protein